MQYKAEQAAPETNQAELEDLDSEDALEPPHHYCNIMADTLYTTVRALWSYNFHF